MRRRRVLVFVLAGRLRERGPVGANVSACESAITALWQGARSPGKFPDHEILPDEHGRPCGDLDGWGELMPAGASGQAGFGIRAGGLASGGS
jgi:hypothetical protein